MSDKLLPEFSEQEIKRGYQIFKDSMRGCEIEGKDHEFMGEVIKHLFRTRPSGASADWEKRLSEIENIIRYRHKVSPNNFEAYLKESFDNIRSLLAEREGK